MVTYVRQQREKKLRKERGDHTQGKTGINIENIENIFLFLFAVSFLINVFFCVSYANFSYKIV